MGSKIAALWAKIKQQVVDIFDKDKGVFFFIAVGAVVFKFRDILLGIMINSAKRVDKNAHTDDTKLSQQENQLNQQADTLVQKAAEEPSKEGTVDDDWYKKNN